jgi:hypothetical protein
MNRSDGTDLDSIIAAACGLNQYVLSTAGEQDCLILTQDHHFGS